MLTDYKERLSPDWWLLRLGTRMRDRERHELSEWRRYYKGDHPLPPGPKEETEAFRNFQKQSRTNLCPIPVQATTHRMKVSGFVGPQGESMEDAWSWWQANKMESQQKQLYRLAFSQSVGYVYASVKTDADGTKRPLYSIEHPRQVITEGNPSTGERYAGLKAWYDEYLGVGRAILSLPKTTYEYRTPERSSGPLAWGAQSWGLYEVHDNPSGRVLFVPFECQPEIGEKAEPLFASAIGVQDRINIAVFNRMSIERYAAFVQKHVTGHQFEMTVDPITGLEVPINPFIPGPDNVWASTDREAQFGYIPSSDPTPILTAIESDVRTFMLQTSTPAYFGINGLVNVSTDTVTILESNHVALVREQSAMFGERFRDLLEIGNALVGSPLDLTGLRVDWTDPRELNPAVMADYGVKIKSLGYPTTMVAERLGEPPTEVDKIRAEEARQQLQAQRAAAAGAVNESRGTSATGSPGRTGSPDSGSDDASAR